MSSAERDRLITDISERLYKMLGAKSESQWQKKSLYPPLDSFSGKDAKGLHGVNVKKRSTKNTKKETTEVPLVPLKEKAPAATQTGEPTMNGASQNSSVSIQKLSEGVKSPSRNARRRKNRKSGLEPKSSILV